MKITIITDTWTPQTNGVVRTLTNLKKQLLSFGYSVDIIEPNDFFTVNCPTDDEIKLALFPYITLKNKIKDSDAIYIANEGLVNSK